MEVIVLKDAHRITVYIYWMSQAAQFSRVLLNSGLVLKFSSLSLSLSLPSPLSLFKQTPKN